MMDAVRQQLADRRLWIGLVLCALALIAAVGWAAILSTLDPRRITDVGLISIIPPPAFALVALLSVSFVVALRLQLSKPVYVVHLAALAFILYGAPAYVEDLPRFATAWLHLGFSEAIARTGDLFAIRDARFDWPAFFTLAAFFRTAMGVDSLLPILPWVPPLTMVLYMGPLYLIMRTATTDGRLIWLTIWFFYLVNWVGQDYFSPQGFNVLLLLSVLAVLLTWFRRAPGEPGPLSGLGGRLRKRLPARLSRLAVDAVGAAQAANRGSLLSVRQQFGLVAVVVTLFGASVASHQLTPFALLGGVVGLTTLRRLRLTGLPVFMIVLLGSWLMFMAGTFLSGHLAGLLEDIGRPDQVAVTNVGERLVGSRGHLLVLQARLALTLGVWGLAFIGGLRRLRAGQFDLTLAVLAVVPFGLLLLQAYGGEMLLRVYLFSVPFMSFFAAAAFLPTPRPTSWRLDLVLVVVSVMLAGVMLLTRFGNEKADFVTPEELEIVEFATGVAVQGDTIGSGNHSIPLGYIDWEEHRNLSLDYLWRAGDMDAYVAELSNRTRDGSTPYFVDSRGQRAFGELFWNMSEAEWEERVRDLAAHAELLYQNRDGAVYRLTPPTETAE